MTIKTIWHEDTYVRSADTDFLQRWKISSFFAAMVEAAAHHADHLGFGFQSMTAADQVWVLSRLKIRFFNFPKIEDQLIIQTWPKGIQQKLFFMRDYHVLGQDGCKFASAASAYVLISPTTRRMLLPQALNGVIADNNGLSALDEMLDKIAPIEELEEQFTTQAGYSTVDLMGHVNNTRYIDWACDCFSFDYHRQHNLRWLQINYVNEIKPGEQVSLYKGEYPDQPGVWRLTGHNLSTGQKAFDMALGWERS